MGPIDWVNSLSPSAAQFWGAVVGVGGGLLAILTGALVNASLNRRRDDRLRNNEARAVAAAIRGELANIRLSIGDLLPIWEDGKKLFIAAQLTTPKGASDPIDASEFASLPPHHFVIFEAYAAKLGLLGSDLAGAVSVVYTNYKVRRETSEQSFALPPSGLPEHFEQQIKWGKNFSNDCAEIERFLLEFEKTGRSKSLIDLSAKIQREQQGDQKFGSPNPDI